MNIVVLSVRLLINCVRPRLVMITPVNGASLRMKWNLIGCFLWLFVSVTRHMSVATHKPADTTYGDFQYEKNHHHGENVHDVPPLSDFLQSTISRKHASAGEDYCVGELHGFLTLIQCLSYGEAKGEARVSKRRFFDGYLFR
jgi:hypothetical protein